VGGGSQGEELRFIRRGTENRGVGNQEAPKKEGVNELLKVRTRGAEKGRTAHWLVLPILLFK